MSISVATWNTQWATPSSDRGPRISSILENTQSDIVVVTEGVREHLPATGSVVDAGGNWGYGSQPERFIDNFPPVKVFTTLRAAA